jgi:predicted MFS family arabinose efflux permease
MKEGPGAERATGRATAFLAGIEMTESALINTRAPAAERRTPAWMTFLLATACGLLAANIYYAQPLIGLIAPSIGLDDKAASLIVTFTQCGYCAGLTLLVPLGDLVENRRLIVVTLCAASAALAAAAIAPSAPLFAAHLAPDASRGRVVGNVMSGLLAGIMLAGPASSLIANALGWRAVFAASAAVIAALALVMRASAFLRSPAQPARS